MARLGPLDRGTVHVAVDAQRLFAEPTDWFVPGLPAILPQIAALARARPERTLFTRFVTPQRAADASGWWRRYYERWSGVTGAVLAPGMTELVAELAALANPRNVIDKSTYSAFEVPAFAERLAALDASTLVMTGVETDVCVLGTLLTAVDRGLRVVAVADALASSSEAGHRATLQNVLPRFDQQVEIMTTAEVLAEWR